MKQSLQKMSHKLPSVLSQWLTKDALNFLAESCDDTYKMLSTTETHQRLVTLGVLGGWSCTHTLPNMCPDFRLPEGKQVFKLKPHYLYPTIQALEATHYLGNAGNSPEIWVPILWPKATFHTDLFKDISLSLAMFTLHTSCEFVSPCLWSLICLISIIGNSRRSQC